MDNAKKRVGEERDNIILLLDNHLLCISSYRLLREERYCYDAA